MSWRQYGGTNKTLINSVNVGSVVANQFLSRSTAANVNQFDNLKVKGQLLSQDYILSGTYIKGLGQLVTSGNLIVKNQQFFGTDASFVDHLPWSYIFGNSYGISINNKNPQAVFHITGLSYEVLKIDTSMNVIRNIIGQNVNAKGIVIEANDTSSNIFFYNDISTNKLNIPDSFIKNNNGLSHGSGNSLFYLQKNGNILLDASSQIFINANKSPGTLGTIFINSNYTSLSSKSKFYLRNPTINNTYNNTYNETVIIYDNSNSTYLYDNYNVNSALTGNALTLISYDNNSNTFLRLIDPSSKGFAFGGGAFAFDTTRSFGTIGINDVNGNYIPTQNIVSGNNNTKYASTIGINTFAPKTENYVLDINGATRIGNGEFKTIFNSNFEIKKVSYSKNSNYVLAIGSSSSIGDISNNSIIYPQYFSYSNNSGLTWNTLPINISFGDFLKNSKNAFNSVSAYNQNFAIIGSINNNLYWTNNSGITWSLLLYNSGSNNSLFRNTTDIYIQRYNSVYRVFLSFEYPNTDKIPKYNTSYFTFDPNNPSDINYSVSDSTKNIQNYFTLTNTDAIPNNPPYYSNPGPSNFNYKINASDCSGQYIYFVGDGIVKIDGTVLYPSAIYNRKNTYDLSYNSVYVYNDNNIIAVGNNIISWTSNGSTDTTGSSWNDIQLSSTNIGNVNLQSIFIYDLSNAIAVGNNGIIIYSNNWKSSSPDWNTVPNTLLNTSGIATRINSTNNKLINIRMPSIDTFIILNVNSTYVPNTYTFGTTNLLTTGTYGASKVFYAFYPNIFNRINNTVFELSGNMVMSGDININDGGQLISNNNTFYILNNNVKNIYIGNAYSTTIIPGSTYIGNDLSVNSRIYVINDVCMNSRLFVSNDVSLNSNFYVNGRTILNGDVSLNRRLFVAGDVSFNSRLFIVSDVSMSSRLFVSNDTSLNSNLYTFGRTILNGDVSLNSSLFVNGDVSFNSRLFINRDVSLNSNLFVGNDITVYGRLNVFQYNSTNILYTNVTTSNYTLIVAEDMSLNGRLTVNYDVSMNSRLFVDSDSSFNSNLYTRGRTINQGDVSMNSRLFVAGDVSMNSRLFVAGDVSMNSRLFGAGDVSFNSNLFVLGKTILQGDVSMNTRMFIPLIASDVSINGNLQLLQNIYIVGRTILNGDVSMNSRLFISNDVSMNSRLFVSSDASFNGNTFTFGRSIMRGDISLNNRLFVNADASFNSNIGITGNITAYNKIFSTYYDTCANLFTSNPNGNGGLNYLNSIYIGDSASSINIGSSQGVVTNRTITIGSGGIPSNTTTNSIYIGGANDRLFIGGSVTSQNFNLSSISIPVFILNSTQNDINGSSMVGTPAGTNYGSSFSKINNPNISSLSDISNNVGYMGAGFAIRDASLNTSGFFTVSCNGDGYYMKAPTSTNIIEFYLEGLKYSTNTNFGNQSVIKNGIMVLTTDRKITSSQNNPIVTYSVSVKPIDVSNIFLRDDLVNDPSFQRILTSVCVVGDLSLNKRLFVSGDVSMNSRLFVSNDVSFNSNFFTLGRTINQGDVSMNTRLFVSNDVSFNSNFFTLGRTIHQGDVSMNTRLFVSNDVSFNSNFFTLGRTINQGDVSMNTRLFVSGDVSFNSNFFTLGRTINQGDVSMNTRLFVSGDVSFNSNFFTLGRTIHQGDVSMNTRLFVSNDVSFNSNFFTLGRTINQGDVSMNTRLFVSNDVSFNSNFFTLGRTINQGDVSMNTRLFVSNDVSFNSNFFTLGRTIHQGDVSMNTRLFVAGDVSLNSNFFTLGRTIQQGDVSINNRLFVSNDVSFGGNLYVANDLTIKGRLNVMEYQSSNVLYTNITTTNYTFIIAEDMSLNGRLTVTSDVSMNNRLFVSNDVSFNSNMFTQGRTINQGDVSMNTRLFVSNDVSFNSNFFTLGRTIHQGDVSLNTRLFVSNDVSLNANFFTLGRTINQGDVSMNTRLFVSNDVSFNSNFFTLGRTIHQGDVSMNTRLFVGGDASFNSRVFITSDVSMNSRLFVSNDVSFNSNFFTLGRTIHQGDVSMNTRLFVGGDASFNSRVFITSDVSMNSRLFVSNDVSFNSNFFTLGRTIHQGDVSLNTRLFVGGDASFNSRVFITSDVSMNSRLFVSNDVSFGRNLFVSDSVLIGVSGNLFKLDVSGTSNFRGTVNPISLIDNSVLLSNAPNLDLSSNFGSSWNPIFTVNNEQITSIAMSATGQYQSATTGSSGTIYTSNNYGFTWTRNNNALITGKYWSTISVSSNGQYQSAGVFGGFICKSSNYGLTWGDCSGVKNSDTATGDGISTSQSTQYWVSIALSSSGQYQAAVTNSLTTGTPNYRGDIYISNNYGDKWNLITNGLSSQNNGPSGAPGNQSYTGIAISSTGQYLAACINRNFIYVSNSYGIFWTQVTTIGQPYTAISMSSSGQYITAVTSNTASGTTYGTIFISANYGITWSDTNTSYAKQLWSGVSISSSGQYQSVISNNGSTNYSFTFSSGATIITSTSSSSTYPFIVLGANVSGSGITPGTIVISATNSTSGNTSFTISSPTTSTGSSLTFQSGAIYSSNNYGVTWFDNTVKNSNKTNNTMSQIWNGIAMNTNGQYQTAVAGGLGGSIFTSITPYQQMVISNNLTVINGDTMLLTRLFVTNDVSFNSNMFTQGRSIQQGDVSMNSRLFVTNDVSFNSNMFTQGRSIQQGDVSMNSRLFVTNDVSFNSNMFTQGRSIQQGDVSMNSRLFVGGNIIAGGNFICNYANSGGLLVRQDLPTTYGSGNLGLISSAGLQIGWNSIVYGSGTTDFLNAAQGAGVGLGGFTFSTVGDKFPTVSTKMIIRGENVGIGTLTPLYKLDVNGNANISSTLNIGGIAYANGKIYSGGNASTYTIMASGEIKLLSSGFKHWSIYNQSGILSIQDTSTSDQTGTPGTNYLTFGATAGLLDVNNILALRNTSTVNYTQYSLLGFGYGGGSTYGTAYRWKIEDITLNRGSVTAAAPTFDYGAQSKLIFSCKKVNSFVGSADDVSYYQLLTLMPGNISNTNTRFGGYVGIGTTSPNFSLSIEYSGTNNDSTTYKNNYGLEIRNNCTQATNTFYNPNLILFSDINSAQGAIGAVREAQSRDYNSGLMFLTNGVGNTYGYQTNSDFTLSERMRITSDGKVGIGTSTPAGKLHLHEATGSIGTGGTSGSLTISHGNQGGASSIVFLSNNNQPTDYGYIRYLENGGDTLNTFNITAGYTGGTGEQGRLEIGTENDNSNGSAADCLILQLSGGNTGIGKLQPAYILDVAGNVSATSYNATSDMRIKSNIATINGTFAVDVLRKLEPKKYSYIDTENDNDYSWGFIGQEIEKVFDYSVTKTKNHIPNVYDHADLSGDRIITLDTKNIKELLSESLNKEYPIRIKLFNKYKKKEITRTIDKIIDDNTFSIIEPITHKDLSGNKLFVYGEVVDDFYNVNYTSVFTLTTAAVKEIDNQLQNALKVIDEQNKTIEMLKNDVSELKTLVNNLMHN
uniref:Peptidase S74 domain-containing protein n=1 Tax=viral metagenome TaxID=1070528 RepID=A0A6C0JPL1_9ZZZZ